MTPGSSLPTLPTLSICALTLVADPPDAPVLELSGTLAGASADADQVRRAASSEIVLSGARLELRGAVVVEGERWRAEVPLTASRWGGPPLPPPSGRYRISIRAADAASSPVLVTALPPDALPERRLVPRLFVFDARATDDKHIDIDISPPLTDDETGSDQQARLEAAYRTAGPVPLEGVFFESFYGQSASCNPLAIDRALAELRPDITRYWSVADASVAVPAGAVALVEGSTQWWNVRASARLLVVNDWLRNRYRSRRGQTVLQTWHGTPLKRIALTRRGLRPRAAVATLRERGRWDILLAQNPFSARVFRAAYAYLRKPWQDGYPRNDVLITGDAAALRARLGIPVDATVLLYAPTWRDDSPDDVDRLGVAAFTRELGNGFVTLIRGHSRSLRGGVDVRADNVIDVTTYPDASELFLIADALITDYSSVMFDFTVTGKPVYFFTPDFDHYRDELRGFYFDLLAVSPGPVVRSPVELIAHLRQPDVATARFADRYAAWVKRFNPRDDGRAAARVVQRLLAEGRLG